MKKLLSLIILIFICMPVNAAIPVINCPNKTIQKTENESILNKIPGLSFAGEKIVETVLAHELDKELNSKINAKLKSFNLTHLRNGEFESLTLKGKEIKYKSFSMSNFNACTVCRYNKVIYEGTRVYFSEDLPFNFTADITNTDIENALNSEKFQKSISKPVAKVSNISLITLDKPSIEIKNNRIYYILPVKTIIGVINIKFNSDIAVKNNVIMMTDIKIDFIGPFSVKNLDVLTDKINPFKYELSSIKGKYCKIYVTKAKISDNIINTEGIFIINKNYNGGK